MPSHAPLKLFRPILPGARLWDRAFACLGAAIGIALAGFVSALLAPRAGLGLWLVPPMGASAVLLFAVPASPMAQPWPTIGGNILSALVGVLVAHVLPLSAVSAGLAVGVAIGVMSVTRTLHPPGGAAALVALYAGASTSFAFPLLPVGINAVLLVACAWLYHRVSRHSYPHVVAPAKPDAPVPPWSFSVGDLAAAIEEGGETLDIDPADLERLLRDVERRALLRMRAAD